VLTRIFLGIIFVLGVAGCATTQGKSTNDQMQSRVVELEKKLEEKDAEIVDLQYEVKDLSSKVSSNASESSAPAVSTTATTTTSKSGEDTIRVNATPERLQTALKNAGFYNGKIDGKIGPGTKAAIIEFQRSKGLTADGVVGRKTWDTLKQYLK
jgi:peptidoglycan hydrolase-like protein with peptidoglycan-binding domain